MMKSNESGFTLLEITVALVILSTISVITFQALSGVDDATKLKGFQEQAQDLVSYLDRVRRSPTSTTLGSPAYPGGSPYTHTYMTLPAESTVGDFRTEYNTAFGEPAPALPSESPFDTPYLITMTADTVFVEASVPFTDASIKGATGIVDGSDMIFRFYPSVKAESYGTNRSAGAAFTKSFIGEAVR